MSSASRADSVRGAADVRFKAAGPGHAMRVKADCCGRYLGSIAGCTRVRGVLLFCPACTADREARKAGRFEAHVRLFREFVLTLRANISTELHNAHALEFVEWLRSLCSNGSEELHDAHWHARAADMREWLRTVTKPDGEHLLWSGGMCNGRPRMLVEGKQVYPRRLVFSALQRNPGRYEHIGTSCGLDRCLSCLVGTPPGQKKGSSLGGIRGTEDIRQRSRIDAQTGCWRWALSFNEGAPRVWYLDPVTGKRRCARGRRAALHLARGRDLPKGHTAYAKDCCPHDDCVNPEHCTSGDRDRHGRYLTRTGKLKSSTRVAKACRETAAKRVRITPEQAAGIKRRLVAGESQCSLAREFGVGQYTIWRIAHDKRTCDEAVRAASNASVFTLGQSLVEAA